MAPLADTSLNNALHLTADEIARKSPVHLPLPGKPVYLAVGADELPALAENSRALAAHYGRRCDELLGHNHFSILDALSATDSPLVARLTEQNRAAVRKVFHPGASRIPDRAAMRRLILTLSGTDISEVSEQKALTEGMRNEGALHVFGCRDCHDRK